MKISDLDFAILGAYLVDRRSHRWITANILKIQSNQIGFEAKRELDKFGIDKKFKNFLAAITSEEELEKHLSSNQELISRSKLSIDDLKFIWRQSHQVFLFQRVIINKDGWLRPSVGRLGFSRDGEYLKENGFGHEDWNFNTDLAINDYVYGYKYGPPAQINRHKNFNIAFCERWADGTWAIVGYYRNAAYIEGGSPLSSGVIDQKTADLQILRKNRSIGPQWDIDEQKMKVLLKHELSALKWKVKAEDVFAFKEPIEIPEDLILPKNDRITTPTRISPQLFESLVKLSKETLLDDDDEMSFREGRAQWVKHKKRERDRTVIAKAKEIFLNKNGRFFCEACGFDFVEKYGTIGSNFIEAHHAIPVSEYSESGGTTHLKDIALLCSNCHRMIHRSSSLRLTEFKKSLNKDDSSR
jgi:hypothetical protein